nr:uncharacterized 30.3 kDa protein [Helicoverpa armigera]
MRIYDVLNVEIKFIMIPTLRLQLYVVGLIQIVMVTSLIPGCEEDSVEPLDLREKSRNSNKSNNYFNIAVHLGIIDPSKHCTNLFLRQEDLFKTTLRLYNKLNGIKPVNYAEWLLLNNYGVLHDNQMSVLLPKMHRLSSESSKKKFVESVRKGDILITGDDTGSPWIGHSALMATNKYVIDMPGGPGASDGIEDNNRRLTAAAWYDKFSSSDTTVYRCSNKTVVKNAADWAYRNYYNPKGGDKKTIHTKYLATPSFRSLNPSYSSKLVIQAFYFTNKNVLYPFSDESIIFPINIPVYFNYACPMLIVGTF